MYVHVRTFVFVYTCMCVRLCVYVGIYMCMSVGVCSHVCICVLVCTCAYEDVPVYVRVSNHISRYPCIILYTIYPYIHIPRYYTSIRT